MKAQRNNATADSAEMELVRAAKRGDLDAFDQLVQRNSGPILRIALHISRRREDAEEIAQETFLKAFKHLSSFQVRARFSTWLTRIAVNMAFVKVRGFRPERTVSISDDARDDELGSHPVDWRPNPEQLYSRLELRNILRKVLESLPLGYSTVFWLRIEGFSITETAEILGISEPAVKTRLLRARLQLRDGLSRYFGQEKTRPDMTLGPDMSSLNGEETGTA